MPSHWLCFVCGSDKYAAILLDIDFDAGFFDDFIDDFTAGTDDIADFVRIDLASSMIFGAYLDKLASGSWIASIILPKNEHTSFFGLLQGFVQESRGRCRRS